MYHIIDTADVLDFTILIQSKYLVLWISLVSTSHPLPMAWTGKALASHLDKSARLESQVKQLIQMANQQQSKLDLRPLFDTIENMKQKIALMETYDQRLGMLALSCTGGRVCWFTCGQIEALVLHSVSWSSSLERVFFLHSETKLWWCVRCSPAFTAARCLLNSSVTAEPQSWPWFGSCTVMEAVVLFRHTQFIVTSFSYSTTSCNYSFKKLTAAVHSLYSGLGRSVLPAWVWVLILSRALTVLFYQMSLSFFLFILLSLFSQLFWKISPANMISRSTFTKHSSIRTKNDLSFWKARATMGN